MNLPCQLISWGSTIFHGVEKVMKEASDGTDVLWRSPLEFANTVVCSTVMIDASKHLGEYHVQSIFNIWFLVINLTCGHSFTTAGCYVTGCLT